MLAASGAPGSGGDLEVASAALLGRFTAGIHRELGAATQLFAGVAGLQVGLPGCLC